MWGWIVLGVIAAVVIISARQYRAQSGTYRPLSSRQPARAKPAKRPLGTEALDFDELDRVNRRNGSLERGAPNWTRGRTKISGVESAATDVKPLSDDETYAKRFHAAFMKNKD